MCSSVTAKAVTTLGGKLNFKEPDFFFMEEGTQFLIEVLRGCGTLEQCPSKKK